MGNSAVQGMIKGIVDHFRRDTTRDDARRMIRDAQSVVAGFYRHHLDPGNKRRLPEAAAADPAAVHRLTEEHFGFDVFEQPKYKDIDDHAWEFSQRYTTLEGVTLPENAVFFTSKREPVTREEAISRMNGGGYHLFDIALSNEYVLLGEKERFNVHDIENRFSTNNEHLPPQSGSRRDGGTRVFKSDPRAIVIAYSETNNERGHLQVVFRDDKGKPIESIALHRRPGALHSELTRQSFDPVSGKPGMRYVIGPEDAPYYAYALALTHFANGFSDDMKKNWFDREQAGEVAKMLRYLGQKDVDENKEPVIRDILADAKLLSGKINPVALLPEMFAAALQKEIGQGKFRETASPRGMEFMGKPVYVREGGFADRVAASQAAARDVKWELM